MVVTHFGLVDVVEKQLYIIPRVVMASDDAAFARLFFYDNPEYKRHLNYTKTDQLPISEVITGLPRPYHHNGGRQHMGRGQHRAYYGMLYTEHVLCTYVACFSARLLVMLDFRTKRRSLFGLFFVQHIYIYKGSGRAGARGPRPSSVKDDFRRQGHSEKKKPYQVRRCGVLR